MVRLARLRPFFGRKLAALFERCSLENIGHRATADVVRGGSPWALWWRDTLDAIGALGLADGAMTEEAGQEHEALTAACTEPSVWLITEFLHTCSGQRPEPSGGRQSLSGWREFGRHAGDEQVRARARPLW